MPQEIDKPRTSQPRNWKADGVRYHRDLQRRQGSCATGDCKEPCGTCNPIITQAEAEVAPLLNDALGG